MCSRFRELCENRGRKKILLSMKLRQSKSGDWTPGCSLRHHTGRNFRLRWSFGQTLKGRRDQTLSAKANLESLTGSIKFDQNRDEQLLSQRMISSMSVHVSLYIKRDISLGLLGVLNFDSFWIKFWFGCPSNGAEAEWKAASMKLLYAETGRHLVTSRFAVIWKRKPKFE